MKRKWEVSLITQVKYQCIITHVHVKPIQFVDNIQHVFKFMSFQKLKWDNQHSIAQRKDWNNSI